MDLTLILLAAGAGSRYGGFKQIDRLGPAGETLIDYALYDASQAGFRRAVFVVSDRLADDCRAMFAPRWGRRLELGFAVQSVQQVPSGATVPGSRTKPWGTAHAVLAARGQVAAPFVVVNADDFYGRAAYHLAAEFLNRVNPADMRAAVVGYRLADTLSEHGAVSRAVCELDARGRVRTLAERLEIRRDGDAIRYRDEAGRWQPVSGDARVSMNMLAFTPAVFDLLDRYFTEFVAESGLDPAAEFRLPQALNRLLAEGRGEAALLAGAGGWFGMTYQADRPAAVERLRRLTAVGEYPEPLWA
ncbi:MAG TPA: NTP transferase domain-containing protein [Acidobacteriota bacterium]|nr:NTP transferase domain-containing protein [Acidobacteriota bacterium]HQM62081.1 NTP transferase domain-containing protein [Acidobacteriota bacterium]